MSRKATCLDNAVAENFFGLLKTELFYLEKFDSVDQLEKAIVEYIDYYNISYSYLHTVIERVRERFPEEDTAKMEEMLTIISNELMPELDMLEKTRSEKAE